MGIEKWTIKEDSLEEIQIYKDKKWWSCDLYSETDNFEIVTVWGSTKDECLERAKLICKAQEMKAALKEIKKISKRLNLWVGIDSIIDPILKDLP